MLGTITKSPIRYSQSLKLDGVFLGAVVHSLDVSFAHSE